MPRLITSSTTPPPSLPRTSYGNCFVCIGFNNSGTGLVADVVKEVGSTMAHLEALIPLIKREMRCEEAENQRDAVFCLGLIAEKQPAVVQNQITALLTVPPPPPSLCPQPHATHIFWCVESGSADDLPACSSVRLSFFLAMRGEAGDLPVLISGSSGTQIARGGCVGCKRRP